MRQKESSELEAYLELCKRIYERKVADGTWDEAIAKIREERLQREES